MKRLRLKEELNAKYDRDWAELLKAYPFQPGDRVRLRAQSVVDLKEWSRVLDRPDRERIYREQTRATVVRAERETWGHTMLVQIDGIEGERSFHRDYWERA